MSTYQTYTAVGQREDLSNVIYNISPTDTPFMNSVGKNSATAVLHEWQTDSLAAVNLSNAVIEGADAGTATLSPTVRVGNRTQISNKVVKISGTLEQVNKAGRRSEKAYQLAKASAELKRDMEGILLSNQVAAAGNGSTTARTLGGLQTWLNSNYNGTGTAGNLGTTARVTGTDRAFTSTLLNTTIQSAYTNGGAPTILLVTPAQKVVASTFTGIATRFRDVPASQQAQVIAAADVYVSDFGIIQIVPDRFIPNVDNDDCAFLLDPEMAAVSYLRPFQTIELAKTGDSENTELLVEYTLEVKNQAAHGIIADLT
jgi:hypothetical protein